MTSRSPALSGVGAAILCPLCRYAAKYHGVDLADHGAAQTEVEADDRYAAAIGVLLLWLMS
jgi:hypothetical protein